MIAFILANSDHGALIVNRFDYNYGFNDQVYGVAAQILESGAYDPGEVQTIKDLLPLLRKYRGNGVVALDCGANIGVHALEWAGLMKGWGQVVAIEAQERIYYALAGNIALHNCFNARAIWAAVSDQDASIDIPEPNYCTPSSFGSFELKERLGNENIGQAINYDKPTSRVRTMTIDNAGLSRVDLIKMDIEGMELEALSGAVNTIKRDKPLLYVETVKIDGTQLSAMLDTLGYRQLPHGMSVLCIHKDDPVFSHIKVEKQAA